MENQNTWYGDVFRMLIAWASFVNDDGWSKYKIHPLSFNNSIWVSKCLEDAFNFHNQRLDRDFWERNANSWVDFLEMGLSQAWQSHVRLGQRAPVSKISR